MSARDWKPGDVALVRLDAETEIRVMRTREGHDGWRGVKGTFYDLHLSARPLVVIDPEDREQVERLLDLEAIQHGQPDAIKPHHVGAMQAALREFANPTPPKPDEPTGLGAVVEDADGVRYVRTTALVDDGDNLDKPWSEGPVRRNWQIVPAVRVLSEGVQP